MRVPDNRGENAGAILGHSSPAHDRRARYQFDLLLATGVILIGLILMVGSDSGAWFIWLMAFASLAYGAYIGLTRGAYWVSSLTYAVPFVAILFGWAMISMR